MPAFYPEGDDPRLGDAPNRSLQKINSLLKSIDTKTGSTTITGPVTVNNEVEVTNSTGNPIPVSGTVALDSTSLAALENISVTFPATQNVNVTNAGLTINDMTSGNAKTKIVDSVGADVSYITAGTAGTPSAGVLSVQGINGGVSLPISGTVTANVDSGSLKTALENFGANYDQAIPVAIAQIGFGNVPVSGTVTANLSATDFSELENIAINTQSLSSIGGTYESAATTDTGTFSVLAFIKRGMQNWTTLLAKIPALVSGRIPVDGSGVTQPVSGTFFQATQPTRETQPTDDYVINTSAFANFGPLGSLLTSAAFDAGASADYVVITLEGGGSSGAFYYDLSILNTGLWDPGNLGTFSTYYDIPASSVTDTYSYRSVTGASFFGGGRTAFNGRFIVPLTQNTPYAGTSTTYRYIRLNCPASYGGWRYRFTSYKSVNSLLGGSIPGNPSTTRVAGRVDVGFVSNLPALPTGTNTIGSVNVLGGNATAVKVDGSAVTQPVSGTVTAAQATSANLKAQAQILDPSGSLLTYAATGTAGTPGVDVVSIQGVSSGVAVAVSGPVTDTQLRASSIPVSDRGSVGQATVTTFTSTSSLVLMASNSARKLLTVFNEGSGLLYLLYGAGTATTANYSVRINSGDYLEIEKYTGTVTGIYGTAGTARVTEIS